MKDAEMINLAGKRCTALVGREFWLKGRQVTELCALFIETDGQR
jgi:hypothetical protein